MGVFPNEHVQCTTWVKLQNKTADWMIIMGKISIVGLALASGELATTDLPSIHINLDPTSFFPKRCL